MGLILIFLSGQRYANSVPGQGLREIKGQFFRKNMTSENWTKKWHKKTQTTSSGFLNLKRFRIISGEPVSW
jgi:hypothetical protein